MLLPRRHQANPRDGTGPAQRQLCVRSSRSALRRIFRVGLVFQSGNPSHSRSSATAAKRVWSYLAQRISQQRPRPAARSSAHAVGAFLPRRPSQPPLVAVLTTDIIEQCHPQVASPRLTMTVTGGSGSRNDRSAKEVDT